MVVAQKNMNKTDICNIITQTVEIILTKGSFMEKGALVRSLCSASCGWWLVLICCERKALLAAW